MQTIFLFDCDNTLFDNDAVERDLSACLEREVGGAGCDRYWGIFEELRGEHGFADYLGALQRYRLEKPDDPRPLRVALFLLDYPFAERLFAGALPALGRCGGSGPTVLLSDGDAVFQPLKVQRTGLWDALGGRVLIYVHKQAMLDAVAQRYPAQHYVMVDDKLRILAAMKQAWGKKLTTIFVRQGHYALDAREVAAFPPADVTIDSIGELAAPGFALPLGAGGGQRVG